jgi:hypothetical protein
LETQNCRVVSCSFRGTSEVDLSNMLIAVGTTLVANPYLGPNLVWRITELLVNCFRRAFIETFTVARALWNTHVQAAGGPHE